MDRKIKLKQLPRGFITSYLSEKIREEFDKVIINKDNGSVLFKIFLNNLDHDSIVDRISSMLAIELNKYIYEKFKETPIFYYRPINMLHFELDNECVSFYIPEEI
ncbi:MAG: hypothetical protein QXD03_03145 [Candidatus Anstonellales archaeon]